MKCFMKLTFGEQFTLLTVKSKENHSPVVTAYWPASLEQRIYSVCVRERVDMYVRVCVITIL